MDDKLINPIPEFVTAEERESILAYRKLWKAVFMYERFIG